MYSCIHMQIHVQNTFLYIYIYIYIYIYNIYIDQRSSQTINSNWTVSDIYLEINEKKKSIYCIYIYIYIYIYIQRISPETKSLHWSWLHSDRPRHKPWKEKKKIKSHQNNLYNKNNDGNLSIPNLKSLKCRSHWMIGWLVV